MEYIAIFVFSVSICLNAALFYFLRKARKKPTPTYGAQELLASLTSGPAVLKIEVVNIEDILIRSPRGSRS